MFYLTKNAPRVRNFQQVEQKAIKCDFDKMVKSEQHKKRQKRSASRQQIASSIPPKYNPPLAVNSTPKGVMMRTQSTGGFRRKVKVQDIANQHNFKSGDLSQSVLQSADSEVKLSSFKRDAIQT